jgi:uncharacterized DUF497 family protein
VVLDDLIVFDWDVHNVGHVAAHGVMPQEIEQAVRARHVIVPAAPKGGEKRWKLFGRTAAGRYLVVAFTIRRARLYSTAPDAVRVEVTAPDKGNDSLAIHIREAQERSMEGSLCPPAIRLSVSYKYQTLRLVRRTSI